MEFQEFIKNRKSQPGFVYIWTSKINGRKYIGSHKGHPQDGYVGSGLAFNNAINKYGIENFSRNIVYRGPSYRKMETFFIQTHKAIQSDDYYNLSHVDDGFCEHSDETRKKMKEVHSDPKVKAKKAASLAVTCADPEWKARRSASATESNNRPETKAKRTATEARPETKARRSASATEAAKRPEVKAKRAATDALPKTQARRSAAMTEVQNRPEVRAKKSALLTGLIYWNNGIINKRSKTCPGPDFVRGRLKNEIPRGRKS